MSRYQIHNRSRQKKGSRIKKISMFIDSHNRIKSVCVYTDFSTISRDYNTVEGVNYILCSPAARRFIRENNCRTLNYYRNGKLKYTCKYYAPGEYNIERNVNY